MFWLNGNRIKLVVVGFVAVVVLGGGTAKADFTFGEPTNLGQAINSPGNDVAPCLSADGLSLYFSYGGDIWVAQRAIPDSEWDQALILSQNINIGDNSGPFITSDGLMLFMDSDRAGGCGSYDLWMMNRTTVDSNWGAPINLGPNINSAFEDWGMSLSSDGLELYFTSNRPGGHGIYDLWVTSRATVDSSWSPPTNLSLTLNTSDAETFPSLSSDGLLLFFCSSRPGGYGSGLGRQDLYMARRTTRKDPWGSPINLGPKVNSLNIDSGVKVSADGSMLYFHSKRPGGQGNMDIWQTPIIPIVDLNADGIVDSTDMVIMVGQWGTDDPLCDIGPMPWGDGIVDVQDLIVLAEYLPPVLLAHWEFDEIEGDIAYDSAGDHTGMLNGNPLWQPIGGKINGALKLDGIDDYLSTPFVLDPSKGSFSVFAWIKGGGQGQVIFSQTGDFGETWLGIDTSEGKLITGFCDVYFDPLESEVVITDDQWHHVGFVYDLDVFHRKLYVDGNLAAEDTIPVAGNPSDDGLYIGASKDIEAGSFFSGLIDDVRIYSRALNTEEIEVLAQ